MSVIIKSIPAHEWAIYDIAYSPNSKLFATASRDKTIKIWDSKTFELLKVINKEKDRGHLNSVNKLIWSTYNNYLISAGDDRAIIIWEINPI
jgi:WD repeat-containing protein 61